MLGSDAVESKGDTAADTPVTGSDSRDVSTGTGGAGSVPGTGGATSVGGTTGERLASGGAASVGGNNSTAGAPGAGGTSNTGGVIGTGGTDASSVSCGQLESPPNGTVSATAVTVAAIATYVCASGYTLTGPATRTCQADGTWDGTQPACLPVDCGNLLAPANGFVSVPGTTFGAIATYSCASGYTLSSNTPRVCQADGTWGGGAPTCNPIDCGAPAAPNNGEVRAATTTYGATASYSCASGFVLVGSATTSCQASGLWSGTAPTCSSEFGMTCSAALDCPANASCCDGSNESCDGTRLPSGDGSNAGEFAVSADGLTVTDTITGLVWQRDGSGTRPGCSLQSLFCTWAEAQAYCASLNLGGVSGWRLPARMELVTIEDFTVTSGAVIDQTAFPNTPYAPAEYFWTSSLWVGAAGYAWYVSSSDGSSSYFKETDVALRVRCVR